jgi:hypothetical protein
VARYSISFRTTNAPSSTLPGASLYAIASISPKIKEVGLFNTTTTACVVAISRLTTAGTQGAGLTESKAGNPEVPTASCTGFQSHTVGPTITDELRRADLGAAIGAGVIWTWDDEDGLRIPSGTGNGIGIVCPSGTGQILDGYIDWIE